MSFVFVLDQNKQPRNPVHPAQARLMLSSGQAAVWRRFPFTIILRAVLPVRKATPLRLKLDPGSHTTGMALVDDRTGTVVWAAEVAHRGHQVHDALLSRRGVRRGRRQRHTRYRPKRFLPREQPNLGLRAVQYGQGHADGSRVRLS